MKTMYLDSVWLQDNAFGQCVVTRQCIRTMCGYKTMYPDSLWLQDNVSGHCVVTRQCIWTVCGYKTMQHILQVSPSNAEWGRGAEVKKKI